MSRKYRVRHETSYKYAADVVHSHHLLHLVPRPAPYQECLEHEIEIDPASHRRVDELDAFGNPLIRIELAQPHRELKVVSQMQIEVHARPAVSPETTDAVGKGARLVRVSRRVAVARPARRGALPPRVAARAPEAILHRLFGAMFSGRAADPGLRGSAEHQAARGHPVRAGRDHHQHFADRSGRDPARRLPGLRASHDLLPAFARPAGALRERLPAHQCHGG